METFTADGGLNIHYHIGLSGEPLSHRIVESYGDEPSAPKTGDAIHRINLNQRKYQKDYMDYWNSTATLTRSRNPVDAILAPVAPFAAFELGNATSLGESITL